MKIFHIIYEFFEIYLLLNQCYVNRGLLKNLIT